MHTAGVMGTHDEETRKYFEKTGVTCQLFVRAGLNESTSILNRNTTDRMGHGIQSPQDTAHISVQTDAVIRSEPQLPVFGAKDEMAMQQCSEV